MDVLSLAYRARASGTVNLPGSKSIANRALLLAALSQGETNLVNMLDSDDTRYMRAALSALGVELEEISTENGLQVRVQGQGGLFNADLSTDLTSLFLGNAGTAMRPLAAALAFSRGHFELKGTERMCERPIGPLVTALQQLGADIEYAQTPGFPPLVIHGQSFNAGHVSIDGSLSSQFISALLMVLPFNTQDTVLELQGELVSLPYIELTIELMTVFGAQVETLSPRRYRIKGQQGYQSPGRFVVEGDASSASYFLAAGAISGGPVRVNGTGLASLQGDKAFAEVLAQMGAEVTWGAHFIEVAANGPLRGGSFDLNAIPDAAMTIATTALFAQGPTEIRNVYNWRLKETDRLQAMACELRKTGAEVVEGDDFLRITPPHTIQHARIATYDDHRMAMCFSLLALSPAGVDIEDPNCCAKTYPNYFKDFANICQSVPPA